MGSPREMDEITTFIKGAICDDQCLGRCLYIHGVPGTGKVNYLHSTTPPSRSSMHQITSKFLNLYLCRVADYECTCSDEEP